MTTASEDAKRTRAVRLTNLRQELRAPVGAILGYSEMLYEDARANGPADLVPDLERIITAARNLSTIVDQLLHSDTANSLFAVQDVQAAQHKLRHDLRTPINAVKGYGEMLLEDLDELGAGRLRADIETLLVESNRLLSQIDSLVDFSRTEAGDPPATVPAETEAATMVAELMQSIRPIAETKVRPVQSGTILVVDDMESNRELLARRLGRDGHHVVVAEGGREALALMEAHDFDLVLLDLMMPDMNGFEVLALLKVDPRLRVIPVIMISALDEIDSVVRCIEAGAEDYLPKPFNPILLKARINAGLEKKRWSERERLYLERLESEKKKYEKLLLNILPQQIVGRLNQGETIIADRFGEVSVLFADLVGFTQISAQLLPEQSVNYLNALFSQFDQHARELGVEKIKMIGDAYMVVAGVPEPRPDHAKAIAEMALHMLDSVKRGNRNGEIPLKIRIGIDSGAVVAGIIGTHRFVYDVWGDTVNVASRLESASLPNRIQISEQTAHLLDNRFALERRDAIQVKGKGMLKTYFLNGPRDSLAISKSTLVA